METRKDHAYAETLYDGLTTCEGCGERFPDEEVEFDYDWNPYCPKCWEKLTSIWNALLTGDLRSVAGLMKGGE